MGQSITIDKAGNLVRVSVLLFNTAAKAVVSEYETCQAADTAPVQWKEGQLDLSGTWNRLGYYSLWWQANVYRL